MRYSRGLVAVHARCASRISHGVAVDGAMVLACRVAASSRTVAMGSCRNRRTSAVGQSGAGSAVGVTLQDQIVRFFRERDRRRAHAGRAARLLVAATGGRMRRFAHDRRGGLPAPGCGRLFRHAPGAGVFVADPPPERVRAPRADAALRPHARSTAATWPASTCATTCCRLRPACRPSTAFPGPPGRG